MSRSFRLAAVAAATAFLLVGCGEDATQQAPPPPEVGVVTLSAAPVALTRELPGRVTASRHAEVRPQVTGIVRELLFDEGGSVEAGQPLYQLEDATFRAELDNARAAEARARATAEAADNRLARAREIADQRLISAQALEDAEAAAAEARAALGVARAETRRRQVILGYARIDAPIAGRIGRSAVTAGALVTANQDAALARIQQLDPMHLDLSQSSTEWLALRQALDAGQLERGVDTEVVLRLEDGGRYPHPGRVAFAESLVDPATGSLTLRVEVPNPDGLLLPGMYLRAEVPMGTREAALRVPQRAVLRDARGSARVMLLDDQGLVQSREVTLGAAVGGDWVVQSGLAAGDRVIVSGLQKVRPGSPARVAGQPQATDAAPAAAPAG